MYVFLDVLCASTGGAGGLGRICGLRGQERVCPMDLDVCESDHIVWMLLRFFLNEPPSHIKVGYRCDG